MTSNAQTFQAVGTGKARQAVGIYPSVAEEVTEVNFQAQDQVEKGALLVQLDDREEQLALQAAKVEMNDTQALLGRYEQAVKDGAVPQSQVDTARADFNSAEVAVEQAKLAIEHRKIRAPFDGVVGISQIDPGDRVGTDTMITGLDARDTIFVDFEVPESLAGSLRNAQSDKQQITATTPAYPNETFEGHISAQESRIDPERRTLMARASIENNEDLLRPGMSFETNWEIGGEEYATVPEISVQWGRDGSYIWLVRDGKAQRADVTIVARKSGRVLLEGDVSENDEVVIQGLQRLRPGQPVQTLSEGAQ